MTHLSSDQNSGWLFYEGDCTTHFHQDYNQLLYGSLSINRIMECHKGCERCSFGLIPWMGHSGPMNSAMPQRTRRKLSSTNGAPVSLGGDLEISLNTYIHTYITLHYITLHYITLHYITLHYITLHYITLHTYIHTPCKSNHHFL